MNIDGLTILATEYIRATGANIRIVPVRVRHGIGSACYYALTDSVRIDPADREDGSVIFYELCHEFTHAYQRHTLGLIRYLWTKTFNRESLELEAVNRGMDACDWYKERERCR